MLKMPLDESMTMSINNIQYTCPHWSSQVQAIPQEGRRIFAVKLCAIGPERKAEQVPPSNCFQRHTLLAGIMTGIFATQAP